MKPLVFALALSLAATALPGAPVAVRAQASPVAEIEAALLAGLEGCIGIRGGANAEATAKRLGFGPIEGNNTRWKTVGGRNVSLRYETADMGAGSVLHNCGVGVEPPLDPVGLMPRVTSRATGLGLSRAPDWTTTQGGKVIEFRSQDAGTIVTWVRFEPSEPRPKGLSLLVYSWVVKP